MLVFRCYKVLLVNMKPGITCSPSDCITIGARRGTVRVWGVTVIAVAAGGRVMGDCGLGG